MDWLFQEYLNRKEEIQQRLKDYKEVPEEEWFYELSFCLLTPGSKALTADACIKKLKELDFKNQDLNIHPHIKHMRFHNRRNEYLQNLKLDYPEIENKLKTEEDSVVLRNWLAENIKGIGLKEASHFLRNIGYRDLAIIDRHILKGLHKANVIQEIPESISKNKYLKLEQSFKDFSKEINIPMDELDLLFWSLQTGKVFK
tara:strand:+ start:1295 stop:1894 length:600 start_codon:yes stop_codon:yes gene_type:complete